jgi:hypothetical protein
MIKPIRRVVTGHDAAGRSIIVSDGPARDEFAVPTWPGRGVTNFWATNSAPASNGDEVLDGAATLFPPMGSGGVSLMIMQIPPEAEADNLPPQDREIATMPAASLFPEALDVDHSKFYGMHATDTVDLLIMLSGELTLLLDEGEVTLKPMDVVIQRGVNHGWVNRGTEVAFIASTAVDAKPLARKRPGKRIFQQSMA